MTGRDADVPTDPRLLERWRLAALGAGVVVGLMGFVVFATWLFPGSIGDRSALSMKIDTALGMFVCGLALALDRLPGRERAARHARGLLGLVAAFSALTFFERVLGLDLALAGTLPRMQMATAFCFCLYAAGAFLQDSRAEWAAWLGQFLIHVLAAVPLLALTGYVAGFQTLLQVAGVSRMAPNTAAAFLLLCAGALLARPERALMRVISSDTMGGMMARRLMPAAILGPIVLGVFCLLGQRAGFYDLGLSIALFLVSNTLAVAYSIWLTADRLFGFDLERRRLEVSSRRAVELEVRNREMEELNQLRNRFLAHMSHEIRTPMNGVIGTLDMLAGSDLDSRQRRFLQLATKSAESLLRVVDDVLDFSRLESGRLELVPGALQLRSTVKRAVATIAKEAEAKGLALEVQISPSVPDALIGDEARLAQVLASLADNAVKFTERGKVRLEVSTVESDAAHVTLRFSISDTGIGIPPEKSRQVFEAFSQADGSIVRASGGTGLGLAIASRIVALMGGSFELWSEPGKGSAFAFTARLQLQPGSWRRDAASSAALPPGEGHRILLVEDHEVNRELATGILENAGFSISLAFDGRQAVELASREPFDLILMDLQLPGMDGIEATAAIRASATGARVPIVALTAHVTREHREACERAGMQGFLSKPVRPRQLLEAVFEAIGIETGATRHEPASAGERAVDLTDALDMTGNDPALLGRVIKTFLGEKDRLLAELDAGIELSDARRIERGAHKLRGSMLIFGARQAAATLERMEKLCSLGNLEDVPSERALLQRWLGQIESELGEYQQRSPR